MKIREDIACRSGRLQGLTARQCDGYLHAILAGISVQSNHFIVGTLVNQAGIADRYSLEGAAGCSLSPETEQPSTVIGDLVGLFIDVCLDQVDLGIKTQDSQSLDMQSTFPGKLMERRNGLFECFHQQVVRQVP